MKINIYLTTILVIILNSGALLSADTDLPETGYGYKCGTYLPDEVKANILRKFTGNLAYDRPYLKHFLDSEQGNFRIHYDTEGDNAVPPADTDANGIPDYVDSCAYYYEYALEYETEGMCFIEPLGDRGADGSERIDIYLVEIGIKRISDNAGGYYGVTYPATHRGTFFILMDNDFSTGDSLYFQDRPSIPAYFSTGVDAMKITAAHELNHGIQYRYQIDVYGVPTMINEMTSSWLEHRLYPEVRDYFQFMPNLFWNLEDWPLCSDRYDAGYRWSIFFQFIESEYGDDVICRTWELIADGVYQSDQLKGYGALDSALKERNSSLEDAWCDFQPWMYYTGKRTISGQYFADANFLPEMAFADSGYVESTGTVVDDNLKPYELRGHRFYKFNGEGQTDDTLDIIVSNTDTRSARLLAVNYLMPYSITVSENQISGSVLLDALDLYYLFEADAGSVCDRTNISTGSSTAAIEIAYPNPFIPGEYDAVYFPVPESTNFDEKVWLFVYDSELAGIYDGEKRALPHQGHLVVRWDDFPDDLPSGVYIFSVKDGEKQTLGKFLVKRK